MILTNNSLTDKVLYFGLFVQVTIVTKSDKIGFKKVSGQWAGLQPQTKFKYKSMIYFFIKLFI